MKCDVLVTYCWNRVGYNIIRSLYNLGLKVMVGDTSSYNICSMSKYSVGKFVYADPFKNEKKFIEDLKKAIAVYQPKVLIPTHDESVIIAKHIKELPSSVIYIMESYEMQKRLSDKYEATKIAASAGVPVPAFISDIEKQDFPIVIKTKIGNSAKGVFFPKNIKAANEILAKFDKDTILIEEYFEGRDYSVDCVRYGSFFVATTYKALVTKTDGGGTTTQRVLVSMPQLEIYAKQILDMVNYQGVCGIDFKVNEKSQKAVFIEVNTRFTGGIATPIAAGFDIPAVVYTLFTTGKYQKPIKPIIGIKTKWILGDVIALVTKIVQGTLKKQELKQIMSWNFDAYDDFRKDDGKAILGEFLYYFMKLVKNRKLNP